MDGAGGGPVGCAGSCAGSGEVTLPASASGLPWHWGRGGGGVAVLGVWREAPDTGASWARGGGLVGWGSSLFCGCRVCAAFRWMVWGSGCAGVAVPSVTSMRTLKGRIMSIPIKQGGDSSPTMTIKLALPLASPHWISRCSVLPAIWSGFPCAPWTVLSNGLSAPHWAR